MTLVRKNVYIHLTYSPLKGDLIAIHKYLTGDSNIGFQHREKIFSLGSIKNTRGHSLKLDEKQFDHVGSLLLER